MEVFLVVQEIEKNSNTFKIVGVFSEEEKANKLRDNFNEMYSLGSQGNTELFDEFYTKPFKVIE